MSSPSCTLNGVPVDCTKTQTSGNITLPSRPKSVRPDDRSNSDDNEIFDSDIPKLARIIKIKIVSSSEGSVTLSVFYRPNRFKIITMWSRPIFSEVYLRTGTRYTLAHQHFSDDFHSINAFLRNPTRETTIRLVSYLFRHKSFTIE
jgi:hypothetical protein